MKKILISILLAIVLVSCESPTETTTNTNVTNIDNSFIEVDYLVKVFVNNRYGITYNITNVYLSNDNTFDNSVSVVKKDTVITVNTDSNTSTIEIDRLYIKHIDGPAIEVYVELDGESSYYYTYDIDEQDCKYIWKKK